MDGYAKSMLYDDVSTQEEIDIECPKCHLIVRLKITDQIIKCKRCGEVFYIEEYINQEMQY